MTDVLASDLNDRDARAGRPKDPAKRAALVGAAQKLFMERGYEATSIDAIALEAGVAKVTVYSHFASKEGLFAAAIRAKCDELVHLSGLEVSRAGSVEDRLTTFALRFFALVSDPDAMAVHRLVTMEGERLPEIAEIFFSNAILNVCDKLAAVLEAEMAAGTLAITNSQQAASHFLALIKGMPMLRRELHLPPMPEPEFAAHLDSAVALFVKAHAPH